MTDNGRERKKRPTSYAQAGKHEMTMAQRTQLHDAGIEAEERANTHSLTHPLTHTHNFYICTVIHPHDTIFLIAFSFYQKIGAANSKQADKQLAYALNDAFICLMINESLISPFEATEELSMAFIMTSHLISPWV